MEPLTGELLERIDDHVEELFAPLDALPAEGHVVTLEVDPAHARIATSNREGAAPGVTIDVRIGDVAESLSAMITRGEPTFDLAFIDADKHC